TVGSLAVKARWIGPARPLVTGYDLLNRVSRFVVPYTRQTWLVALTVTNVGELPIRMRATDWQLTIKPGDVQRVPLDVPFFKERWPTEAVRSEAMMLDQAMAIGHVIRTLWGDRVIEPSETATGILPFLSTAEAPTRVHLTWSAAAQPVVFQFGVRP
ncbi:MAG: hypothetical protein H7338_02410, partial [Candidatus Sericytochromatia bacterium]|nr:hypothetical protein [Candidatus Sericytochromatia bacterium]